MTTVRAGIAFDRALAKLTAPGGPFELETLDAPGGPVRNFLRRERSIVELLQRAARRGEREFLVEGSRRLSFAEFANLVWGTARSLRDEHGLKTGDRVAIVAPNSVDWLLAAFGAVAAGGVAVGLNPNWAADELEFAVKDCGARHLVVDAGIAGELPTLVSHFESGRVLVMGGAAPAGTVPFGALVAATPEPPDVELDEDDAFVILYTSGTTGRPKGCITTHRGTIAQVRSVLLSGLIERELAGESTGERPARQPVLLVSSPMFHVSGLHAAICLALFTGTKTVLATGRFDPREILRLIEEERVTAWGAVPTMVHRVVECPEIATTDLSTLETVAIGGAPLPPAVLERARARLGLRPKLGNGYGLTETHGAVTMNSGASLERKAGSVGRPSPIVDLQITDDGGRPAPVGAVGEIRLHGPTVTPGYWNRPEENAEILSDGWLRTGDLGYVDDDGFMYLVDRLKDMVIRGGENVYCVEVEDALGSAPAVDEVAVFGVPDEDLGERVAAVVRLRPGATTTAEELRRFLAGRLARYKIPDRIDVTDEPLPRTATGKVQKNEVRRRLVEAPSKAD